MGFAVLWSTERITLIDHVRLRWPSLGRWRQMAYQFARYGLIVGLIFGLIVGLIYGLSGGLISRADWWADCRADGGRADWYGIIDIRHP